MDSNKEYDVFCIGAGIMSTTLASILKELNPNLNIGIVERLGVPATESSNAFCNAGTGHSGFCELNYDLQKAIKTCEAFERSKQFWTYLVKKDLIKSDFIHQVPHISFVQGQENVDLLKLRWMEMKKNHLFADMEFSDDQAVIKEWIPLVMHSRNRGIPIAATRVKGGTDIDFGALTKSITSYLYKSVKITYFSEVIDIKRNGIKWDVTLMNRLSNKKDTITTKFLFIGAGGATLTLLQKSGIPEIKGYGGFPVSGEFLICDNPKVVNQHNAKVYGKPETGSPPMSQPHLDTRIIEGKKVLLFGPYAAFSSKFLKYGKWSDFFKSLRLSNIFIILSAGLRNLGLSKYLLKEVTKSHDGRIKSLLEYYPNANPEDWRLITAGQRVQVIKKDNGTPTIEFGTEIVTSADGSLAGLLGASPGGSVCVSIMLDVIQKSFKNKLGEWLPKIKEMVPSYGQTLEKNKELLEEVNEYTSKILNIK